MFFGGHVPQLKVAMLQVRSNVNLSHHNPPVCSLVHKFTYNIQHNLTPTEGPSATVP